MVIIIIIIIINANPSPDPNHIVQAVFLVSTWSISIVV